MPLDFLGVVDRTSTLMDAFLNDVQPRQNERGFLPFDRGTGYLSPDSGGRPTIGFDGGGGFLTPEVMGGGFIQALGGLFGIQPSNVPLIQPRQPAVQPAPQKPAPTPAPASGSPSAPLAYGATKVAQGGEAFIRSVAPMAERLERQYGIPREVTAAIAANETGYGSPQYTVGNNLFGIKAVPGQPGVTSQTWEWVNGKRVDGPDTFAAYDSPDAAGEAFGRLLSTRYQSAFQAMNAAKAQGADRQAQIDAFVQGVHAGGYATDPRYAEKITSLTRTVGPILERNVAPIRPVAQDGSVFPVQGYTGVVNLHHGQVPGASDLFAQLGTPVLAMRSGRVLAVTNDTGDPDRNPGGNSVLVLGDDGRQYYYAHMGAPPTVGSTVQAGQQIGVVGRTGNAARVNYPAGQGHLHIGFGPEIINGVGPTGGTGGSFDAVGILRALYAATARGDGR